jgi:hypothetical protein
MKTFDITQQATARPEMEIQERNSTISDFVQLNKPRLREYRTASAITGPVISNRHAPNALPSPHWFPTAEDHRPVCILRVGTSRNVVLGIWDK